MPANAYKITTELYQIPYEGQYILYAPLKRWVLLVNPHAINVLADIKSGLQPPGDSATHRFLEGLVKAGIVNGTDDEIPQKRELTEFKPVTVTIFPTSDCNLRCVYCYGKGGDRPITITWKVVRAAIDFTIANCIRQGRKVYSLSFHGGGEPTVAWDMMVQSTEYARNLSEKHGLRFETYTATNGILGSEKFEWMMKNISRMNLSWDGPPDIQDIQRPFANGRGSSRAVLHTVARLKERGRNFGIRATISQYSVHRMKEMVDYFYEESGGQNMHFEPLFSCGRCATSMWREPPAEEFIVEFLKARAAAEELGVSLYYSGQRVDNVSCAFCGAAGTNFSVTPEGYITSCHEVSLRTDPRSKIFLYGQYDDDCDSFEIWEDRLEYLLTHTVHNMEHCADCFLKWHCAGDCLAKVAATSDLDNPRGTPRCYINQQIATNELAHLLEGKKGRHLQPLVMDI